GIVSTFVLKKVNKQYQKAIATTTKEHLPSSATQESLNNIINTPVIVLQNSQIICTRGCLSGSSNHQQISLTKRDSSEFEFIEHQ
ncbi:2491_t:CDS:2, partial [Cetraspora pellucida]